MRNALYAFSALSTLSALCPSPMRAQTPEQTVLAVVRRLFDGMRRGDSAMVRSVFDSTMVMISVSDSAGRSKVDRGSADRFVAAVGRPHPEVWDERIWDTEVRVDGGLASVWTKYAFYRGDQFSHCGVDVFELARRAEGWRIIYLADTRRRDGCWTGPK